MTATAPPQNSEMAAYLKRRILHIEERLAKSQRYAQADQKELNEDQKNAVARIPEVIGIVNELKNVLGACNRIEDAHALRSAKHEAQNAEQHRTQSKQDTVAEVGELLGILLHRVAQKARSFDGSPHNPEDQGVYTLVVQLQSGAEPARKALESFYNGSNEQVGTTGFTYAQLKEFVHNKEQSSGVPSEASPVANGASAVEPASQNSSENTSKPAAQQPAPAPATPSTSTTPTPSANVPQSPKPAPTPADSEESRNSNSNSNSNGSSNAKKNEWKTQGPRRQQDDRKQRDRQNRNGKYQSDNKHDSEPRAEGENKPFKNKKNFGFRKKAPKTIAPKPSTSG